MNVTVVMIVMPAIVMTALIVIVTLSKRSHLICSQATKRSNLLVFCRGEDLKMAQPADPDECEAGALNPEPETQI